MGSPISVTQREFEALLKMKEEMEKEAAEKPGTVSKVSSERDPGKVTQRELWEYAKPKLDAAEKGIKILGAVWVVRSAAMFAIPVLFFTIFGFVFASMCSHSNRDMDQMERERVRFSQKVENRIDEGYRRMEADRATWPGSR